MGAVFCFRRDPSRDYKYACVCGNHFRTPSTLRYHIEGKPFQIPSRITAVQEILPSKVNNLEIMSDIVGENARIEPNIDPEENVNSVRESEVDANLEFRRIRKVIDIAFVKAIEALQKARQNIQNPPN
ncbi:hypothetical protein BGZ74_011451 [Mortierella antarctica]|nr:hypothetical protein BGZ74_011451 [Mortierella antarctica]